MDPRELLQVSMDLARKGSAAAHRSAVSRAYYAAFNVGREVLGRLESKWRLLQHGELWRYLANCGQGEVEEVGTLGGQLHSARVSADYHMHEPEQENQSTASLAVVGAELIIGALDKECAGPEGRKVRQGIHDYLRRVTAARGGRS